MKRLFPLHMLVAICGAWVWALVIPPATVYADNSWAIVPLDQPATPEVPRIEEIPADPVLAPEPEISRQMEPQPAYRVVVVRALITACSPEDAIDRAYYARHGYEGSTYNIAADLSVFPRGTQIRVPGYMDVSYPDRFWSVDSAGGSIIRRSTAQGIIQLDVKYRTEYSAIKWGRQWLNIEVVIPPGRDGECLLRRLRPHIVRYPHAPPDRSPVPLLRPLG